jgi:DNA helicase-2/ATP-dependent DNA helicase PcrA
MDLTGLNDAQRGAVTAPAGPHLVVAGAGTGKTKTLVHRVAWWLHQAEPPEGVVLLTFSRRAAHEMLERVAALVGPEARRVRGGTFHAFANVALRRFAGRIGYGPGFTILDRDDASQLVGLVRAELGLDGGGRRFARRDTLLDVMSRAVNTGATIAEVLAAEAPQHLPDADDFVRVRDRYEARKRQHGVVDYDDLLVLLDRLLTDDAEARHQLASSARHVLVDEYQDTNKLQARIASLLAVVHGDLMVVGDEAQSIYGFRGAAVENILAFPSLWEGCRVTLLEDNYRSVQPVLEVANGVLASATRGYRKRLRAHRSGGTKPRLVEAIDEQAQAAWVVSDVLARREQGVGLDRQAVLFRSAWHANLLEVALSEARIPYRKFGGLRFGEAAHVKDAFALLRLIANPRDAVAWFRVLRWLPGLGDSTAQKLADRVVGAEVPRLDPGLGRGKRYHADLVTLTRMLDVAGERVLDVPFVVECALAYYRSVLPDLYEDWPKRERDLDAVGLLADRARSLESFLADVALDPVEEADARPGDAEDEVLTLSTVHSAKGLEWDAVTVIQLADGMFPSAFSLESPDELEEERRLLYVAVTRARTDLALVQPRFLRTRRGPAVGPGCQILDSVPDLARLVERVRIVEGGRNAVPMSAEAVELDRVRRLLERF